MPDTPDAYTHRIGRTGRAEREGKAYTFITGDDTAAVRDVERRLGSKIPRRSLEGFDAGDVDAIEPPKRNGSGRFGRQAGRGGSGRSRNGAGNANSRSGASGQRAPESGSATPGRRRRRSRRPAVRRAS
jgi:ATP-dependent RNA helicase RhlE